MIKRATWSISVITAFVFVWGCVSYESKVVPFKMLAAYPRGQHQGLPAVA
ncbi:MAG TPA: hypothetical protein VFG29_14185 [Syntrophales bacterium]|nr:hypothetical protein [Syntrophales bacterium]